jgi:hypothetical protein
MGKRATREAFGETLVELANEGMNVCAVDADLAGSTTTNKLQKAYPDRFVDVGIAEQDMIGVAAGLSLTGRIPFTGVFCRVWSRPLLRPDQEHHLRLQPQREGVPHALPASRWARTARRTRCSRTSA